MWGFTDVKKNWNWTCQEGTPVQAAVFSNADTVELYLNGTLAGICKAGERLAANLPKSFLFDVTYAPGTLEARSYVNGELVSTDTLVTTGAPAKIVLRPEKTEISPDGHSLSYVAVEVTDESGLVVPDAAVKSHATVKGSGSLDAFGSSNPITDENYTTGDFTTYQGRAMAIVRSGL